MTGKALLSCLILAVITILSPYEVPAVTGPCEGQESSIVVDTGRRMMWICAENIPIAEYFVALGQGGTGKTSTGDMKTPLGEYSLGIPRPSKRYGIFIPVKYPTFDQWLMGFSGGDIGIHGPDKNIRQTRKRKMTTFSDWTRGCIAVENDYDISELARWIRNQRVTKIVIK